MKRLLSCTGTDDHSVKTFLMQHTESNFRIGGHGGTLYLVLHNCYQLLSVASRWTQAVAVAFPSVAAGCHFVVQKAVLFFINSLLFQGGSTPINHELTVLANVCPTFPEKRIISFSIGLPFKMATYSVLNV